MKKLILNLLLIIYKKVLGKLSLLVQKMNYKKLVKTFQKLVLVPFL